MKTPDKTEAAHDSPDALNTALDSLQDAGLGSLTWMGSRWAESMSDFGSEAVSFVAERVREDAKTQHQILQCKSFSEVQAVQLAFLERAFNQYTVETGKMLKLSGDLFGPAPVDAKSTPV